MEVFERERDSLSANGPAFHVQNHLMFHFNRRARDRQPRDHQRSSVCPMGQSSSCSPPSMFDVCLQNNVVTSNMLNRTVRGEDRLAVDIVQGPPSTDVSFCSQTRLEMPLQFREIERAVAFNSGLKGM